MIGLALTGHQVAVPVVIGDLVDVVDNCFGRKRLSENAFYDKASLAALFVAPSRFDPNVAVEQSLAALPVLMASYKSTHGQLSTSALTEIQFLSSADVGQQKPGYTETDEDPDQQGRDFFSQPVGQESSLVPRNALGLGQVKNALGLHVSSFRSSWYAAG